MALDLLSDVFAHRIFLFSFIYFQWRLNEFESGAQFFCRAPSTFLAVRVQLVLLVSAFVMVDTVWSVSCLLFFYSRYPQCQAISKSGGDTCPRALWSQRQPLFISDFSYSYVRQTKLASSLVNFWAHDKTLFD